MNIDADFPASLEPSLRLSHRNECDPPLRSDRGAQSAAGHLSGIFVAVRICAGGREIAKRATLVIARLDRLAATPRSFSPSATAASASSP